MRVFSEFQSHQLSVVARNCDISSMVRLKSFKHMQRTENYCLVDSYVYEK